MASIGDTIANLTSHRTAAISNVRTPELTDSMDKILEVLRKLEVRMAKVERRQNKRSTSHSQNRGRDKGSSKAPMSRLHKEFGDKTHCGSPPRSLNGKPGKSLIRQPEETRCSGDHKISRLLFVRDHTTGIRFLVDSGVQISIIPATETDKKKSSHKFTFQAIKKSLIKTHTQRCLTLNSSLRRAFTHIFVITDVEKAIWVQIFYTNMAFSRILTGIARRTL